VRGREALARDRTQSETRTAMAESQDYKNHARWLPAFHFFATPVLFIHTLVQLWAVVQSPSAGSLWAAVVAAALLTVAFLARTQALTAQDRVIRLEMRLRLRDLLSADLQSRVHELTPRQMVALRFASDGELPGLVQEVLSGSLKSQKEIKARIRHWQADWLRV